MPAATQLSATPADTGHPPPPTPAGDAGDYRSPLRERTRFPAAPRHKAALPGSDTPLAGGIQLREDRSLQQKVRAMTVGSRCKYARMKMAASGQFLSGQQMERLLEADGCGPHQEATAADATIKALSHRVIFGD